jgi:hypothetical protein
MTVPVNDRCLDWNLIVGLRRFVGNDWAGHRTIVVDRGVRYPANVVCGRNCGLLACPSAAATPDCRITEMLVECDSASIEAYIAISYSRLTIDKLALRCWDDRIICGKGREGRILIVAPTVLNVSSAGIG